MLVNLLAVWLRIRHARPRVRRLPAYTGFPSDASTLETLCAEHAATKRQRDTVDVRHLIHMRRVEHSNLDPDAARAYIQSLSADKRYHRDVY